MGRRAPPSNKKGTFAWRLEHDFIRIITTTRLFAEPPINGIGSYLPGPPDISKKF